MVSLMPPWSIAHCPHHRCRTSTASRSLWYFLDLGFSTGEQILTVRGDGYTELTKGRHTPRLAAASLRLETGR